MKNSLISIVAIIGLLFFASCSFTTYLPSEYSSNHITTSINSFGNYNFFNKTFYIESGDENISSNDVEFKEYANYLANCLKFFRGAKEIEDKKNADICILINYGISDESYIEQVPIPIYGNKGISSISTRTRGSVKTTNVSYNTGITGYNNVNQRVDNYYRFLNIYGYDNNSTNMLWKVNLSSSGSNNDLRYILPYMIYSASSSIGVSSEITQKRTIYNGNYFFKNWKNGKAFNDNYTEMPKYSSTNAIDNIKIASVEKLSTETIVVIYKYGCVNWSISPKTYIEYNGQKYMIKNADDYELGKKIKKECGARYVRLHFQAIPLNAKNINISEGTKKGLMWKDVSLK
jgi:hypothetical protein